MTRSTIVRTVVAATLAAAMSGSAFAQGTNDPSRRDEFGLRPDDATDEDLALPDPVLDRSWPAPQPGDGSRPPGIAPDEDDVDPFREDAEPEAPARPAPPAPVPPPAGVVPKQPPRPIIGPDGRIDPGTPLPAPDAQADDPLDLEESPEDLTDVEKEERAPSAFDRGQGLYEDDMHRDDLHDEEMNDPGEW